MLAYAPPQRPPYSHSRRPPSLLLHSESFATSPRATALGSRPQIICDSTAANYMAEGSAMAASTCLAED